MKRQPNIQTPLPIEQGGTGATLASEAVANLGLEVSLTGDVLYTMRDNPAGYIPADGSIVLQSAYPELFAETGLLGGTPGFSPLQDVTPPFTSFPPPGVGWSPPTNSIYSIVYAQGQFFAVGELILWTSPDGENWTEQIPHGIQDLRKIAFINDTFMAVGGGSTIITSSDGLSWTAQSNPGSNRLTGIAYGQGLYVVCGLGGTILTSPNLTAWTSRTTPSSDHLLDVVYGNGVFVASGAQAVWRSTDGINWTEIMGDSTYQAVTFGNGLFVLGCVSGGASNTIQTSADGLTWTNQPVLDYASSISKLIYSDGLFFAIGGRYTDSAWTTYHEMIWYSSDGVNWNEYYLSSTARMLCLEAVDGFIVVGGLYGAVWNFTTETFSYNKLTHFQVPNAATGDVPAWVKT